MQTLTLELQRESHVLLQEAETEMYEPEDNSPEVYGQKDHTHTVYSKSSLFGKLHYLYLNSFTRLINNLRDPLTLSQMINFNAACQEPRDQICRAYNRYKRTKSSFLGFIIRHFRGLIAIQLLCAFLTLSSQVLVSLGLQSLIYETQQTERNSWRISLSLLLTILTLFALCYSNSQYFVATLRLAFNVKNGIIRLINHKIYNLSNVQINQISKAKLLNIISSDTVVIETQNYYSGYPIFTPLFLVIHIYVLWRNFGPAGLLGVLGTFTFWPWLLCQARIMGRYIAHRNTMSDKRVSLIKEFIEKIRFIKMTGQLETASKKIRDTRAAEASYSTKLGSLNWGTASGSKLVPLLSSLPMFLVYHINGGELTLDKIFMALLLLSYTKMTLVSFNQMGVVFYSEFFKICKRCEEILNHETLPMKQREVESPADEKNAVEIKRYTGWWKDPHEKPVLEGLDFALEKGTLTIVLGKVGSGKSSLISAILQEIPHFEGEVRTEGNIAIVEQEPSIFSGTVRENITFGKCFDEEKYRKIIQECNLVADLNSFHNSDQTLVGESGYSLSGGQKARVVLARAIYSEAEIVLLDDPLSALDSRVAQKVYDSTIKSSLRNKTVLMVTNNWYLAKLADNIIILEDGQVKAQGTYDNIKEHLEEYQDSQKEKEKNEEFKEDGKEEVKVVVNQDRNNEQTEEDKIILPDSPEKNEIIGNLDLITFKYLKKYYRQERSQFLKALFGILGIFVEVGSIAFSLVIGAYTKEDNLSTSHFTLFALFILVLFILSLLRGFIFSLMTIRVATNFHNDMLDRIGKTQSTFFDVHQAGDIISKFSSDVGAIERGTPFSVYFFLDGAVFFLSMLATLWFIQPLLILHALVLGALVYVECKIFVKPLITIRSLEIQTQGPVLNTFNENLSGISTLRIYKKDVIALQELNNRLYENNTCALASRMYTQGFGFWLELGFVSVNSFVLVLLAFYSNLQPLPLAACMMILLQWGDYAQFTIRCFLEIMVQMSSVKRMMHNLETPLERDHFKPSDRELPSRWPENGSIVFSKVATRYRPHLPLVLKGIDFTIAPGEKIACVGRTGAGKSSITQLLFGMIDLDRNSHPDSKIYIDGIDAYEIGLQKLRQSFSLIAQAPIILSGTIRENIDPFGKYSDSEIWKVLRDVTLETHVRSLRLGLQEPINDKVTLFSSGQKQLINLARVILNRSKVVVLDEATSLIDYETDKLIQKILLENLSQSMVFNVAHRLSTIASYDKVMVLQYGEMVEFGRPYELLVKNIGDETITNTESYFAKLVLGNKSSSKSIFETAKSAYFRAETNNTEENSHRLIVSKM